MSRRPKVLVILGPTATGKSDLAVKIAKKFNGEIVSADSRQVYVGVNLGSDKVKKDNAIRIQNNELRITGGSGYFYKGIRHHLIDVVSPKKSFTVVQYKKLAERAIKDIRRRGNPPKFRGAKLKRARLPIICGGTGLYIDALIHDWKLPAVKPNLKLRRELEKKSAEELFEQLKKLDPRRAKNIDRHNKRRLVRALEIVIETGKPTPSLIRPASRAELATGQARPSASGGNKRIVGYDVLKIGIKVAPEELKKRIKKRTFKRLREGVIQEMEDLRKFGVSQKRLNDISLYYRWVEPYLKGEAGKTETLDLISTKIWQYAKRQMTWFKRDKSIRWISKNSEAERLVKKFLE